jgi:tetratricopeptide (TPR) repeat protein
VTDFEDTEELAALGQRFLAALQAKDVGNIDDAEDELREILRAEPRLAEPRMELARILLDTNRLEDAEVHAREALERLLAGGQWTDDLPEDVVRALCHALLAEILRRRADEDGVIFGDPEAFRRLVKESQEHFQLAAALDPSDEYSSYYAAFMGPSGTDGEE